MLRKTWAKLELISDPAMFEMIDGGIRGGVAMISTRYARANNEGMGELYDATKPASTIKGLDANNLYRSAVSQPPTRWSVLMGLSRSVRGNNVGGSEGRAGFWVYP